MNVILSLGVPTHGDLKVDMVKGLLSLMRELPYPIYFNSHKGCYIHRNRESIVKRSLKQGATHLMFIDTDIIFPPGSVQKLIDQKKEIIGGIYNLRSLPERSVVLEGLTELPTETFRTEVLPTGFMLIDLSIMSKIPKPWFFFDTKDGEFNMGEDAWFCKQARSAGIELWCDPTIALKHAGDFLY